MCSVVVLDLLGVRTFLHCGVVGFQLLSIPVHYYNLDLAYSRVHTMTCHHTLFKHPISHKSVIASGATRGVVPVREWINNLTVAWYHGSRTYNMSWIYRM